MIERLRVVLDTNALISRLLMPNSAPARAVRLAVAENRVLASDDTLMELADVLGRPVGTLKAQVHRGVALLRAAFEADERRHNRAGPATDPQSTFSSPALATALEAVR